MHFCTLFRALRALIFRRLPGRGVYYIGGADTLPPPLSPEEEAYLLSCLGDGRARVRDLLIEHNLRLVVYIAKKFENTGINIEDLISIGTIGLIKGVNTFRPEKNIKLATYASRCIENEILMHLRKTAAQRTEISIDEPLNCDADGNELLLSDILGCDDSEALRPLEEQDDRRLLRGAVERLSERDRTIIEMRYGLRGGREKTQKEVAACMGISQSYISRIEKRILARLRRELGRGL
ncbi:MAG: RNA polymerase sporulation sigma factor SigE [Clostridia bacterium]|nr:RNA polymerase sporulation sigma factor SigE [Clostridia bacterium]